MVYVLEPRTWFEDGWSYYEVAPDGSAALFGARFGFELVDLVEKRTDAAGYRGAFDDISAAVFDETGRLVRLGTMTGQSGWFIESGDGLQPTPLPWDAAPRWSHDGSRVAYHRSGEPGLYVGSPAEPDYHALGAVSGIAWSPGDEFVYALVFQRNGLSTLIRLEVANGTAVALAEDLDATYRFNSIGVAPDGRALYLALAGSGPPDPETRHQPDADRDMDIYELDLETGQLNAVIVEPGDDFYPLVVSGHLYWTHNDIRDEVIVVPREGGPAHVVIGDAQIPTWSHDGGQIAFTYGGWRIADWALNLDAAVIEVDGDARRVSDPTPIVVGYHEDFTPVWSPDGSWIAYHSHRANGPVPSYAAQGSTDDIYIRRTAAAFEDEIRLSDFGWEVGMADWAPDGRRLVFDSWDRDERAGKAKPWIATIDPTSGAILNIEMLPIPADFGGTLFAAWSPDGARIALTERVGSMERALWVFSADGSAAVKLLDFKASTYGGVDWTPDGASVIYSSLADGRMQLFQIAASGGEARQLTHDDASLLHPQVSPDGRWIAATRIHRSKELRRRPLD